MCDGLDSDCDGRTDESVRRTAAGVVNVEPEVRRFVAGELVDNCRPLAPAADDSSCDEIDSDCDGNVDEDYRSSRITCGVGVCAANGITQCFAGRERFNCREGQAQGDDANCDGLDDDCDGAIDEDFRSQRVECGQGACTNRINSRCIDGRVDAQCRPEEPLGADDQCDGVDTDCDGRIDEGVARATECGVGACLANGMSRCEGNDEVDDCTPGEPAPDDRSCDGIDDDCDHAVDEDCPMMDMGMPTEDAAASSPDSGGASDGSVPSDSGVFTSDANGSDLGTQMGPDAETIPRFDGGRPADFGYIDALAFGSEQCDGSVCEDLGGAERSRPVTDGCACDQGASGRQSPLWLWVLMGVAIRRSWLKRRRATCAE